MNRASLQPLFTLIGLSIDQVRVPELTREFIGLKREFFPKSLPLGAKPLEWILVEIKGADVRKSLSDPSRRQRRHAVGFLDKLMLLLEKHDCRIKGRVWIKGVDQPFNGRSVYTASMQYIHQWFQHLLELRDSQGVVVCDSRNKSLNSVVSQSIFTEKYRFAGDKHPRIVEMPVFGHSENHAGIQIADLMCSALLFPMAIDAYCGSLPDSLHVRGGYEELRPRYGARLEALQDRVPEQPVSGRPRLVGGVMVGDALGQKPRSLLFRVK